MPGHVHRHTPALVLVLVAAAAIAVGCGGEDNGGAMEVSGTAPLRAGVTTTAVGGSAPTGPALTARLQGSEEVPGPGDPDGRGAATLRVDGGRLCVRITVTGLDEVTAAHVHTGASGLKGPVAVTLPTPSAAGAEVVGDGCTDVTPSTAGALTADPAGFYVNVHTKAFPDGAVRGQVARA